MLQILTGGELFPQVLRRRKISDVAIQSLTASEALMSIIVVAVDRSGMSKSPMPEEDGSVDADAAGRKATDSRESSDWLR